ncbi:MAG: DUF4446 family protein [Candidatus Paceibacterota bacterium]
MNLALVTSYITDYATLLLATALILVLFYVVYLHYKLSHFMRGEDGKSLESTIRTYLGHVDNLKKHDELIAEHALKLDKRLSQAVRNVSTMRFKAFDQNASNQSFAIALVNELGDGVILSSLHHRDRVSVFAKPVSHYESSHDLTEEEQGVLEEAKLSHKS